MTKIIIVTISILLTLTFNFYAVNRLNVKSSTRAVTMNTSYSLLPENNVIDNKHVTSYKNTGTVLEY